MTAALALESFSIISSFLMIVKLFFEILLSSFPLFSCVPVASARDNFYSIRCSGLFVNIFLKFVLCFAKHHQCGMAAHEITSTERSDNSGQAK